MEEVLSIVISLGYVWVLENLKEYTKETKFKGR